MVRVETATDRRAGVTFVTAAVTNTRSTPQTVRMRASVDGPMWEPQSGSGRSPEWGEETWEATVLPGQTRGTGFATPVEPTEPAIELVSVTRQEGGDAATRQAAVLAELDDWSPPSEIMTDER
jgi:hypothetical protein